MKYFKIIILCIFGLLITYAQGYAGEDHPQTVKREDGKIVKKKKIENRPIIKRSADMPFEDVVYHDFKDTKGKLFVVGIFKKAIPAILLSEDSSTCLTETTNTGLYEHPDGPLEITNIKINTKCKSKKYFGALMGVTEANYQYLKLKTFKDSKLANSIYIAARKFEDPKCPDYLCLTNSFNNMWSLQTGDDKVVIAQIKRKSNSDGTLFIFKNNHTYPLEGGCAHEIKAFSINGHVYIEYFYSGCDNGESVICVYDLSENIPKLVYRNGAWST